MLPDRFQARHSLEQPPRAPAPGSPAALRSNDGPCSIAQISRRVSGFGLRDRRNRTGDRRCRLHRLSCDAPSARGRSRGRRRRQPDALLRSGAEEARLEQFDGQPGFRFVKLDLADRDATAALFAAEQFPFVDPSRRPGRRALLAAESACLCGCQPAGLRSMCWKVAAIRLPPSGLCLVVVGLWRQHADAVSHHRQRRSSAQPLCRVEEGQRADGACLCASVQAAGHRPALLHGLRPVGPARHGDVDFRRRRSCQESRSGCSTTARCGATSPMSTTSSRRSSA